jgi:hypothetical protein
MRSTIVLSLCLALVACGDDAETDPDAAAGGNPDAASSTPDATPTDPDASTGGGTATITGTLSEQTVNPTSAYLIEHPLVMQDVLVMPESGVSCSVEGQPDLTAVIGFACGDPSVGTHDVRDPEAVDCMDTPHVFFLVEGFTGEFSEYLAATGTVTVDTLTAEEITGSFTADFGDKGTLTGTFAADVCD